MPDHEQEKRGVPSDGSVPHAAYDHPGGADSHGHHEDPHGYNPTADHHPLVTLSDADRGVAAPVEAPAATPPPPPNPTPPAEEDDEEDDGMLRMSFLEHLEELRSRLIKIVVGLVVAYGGCLIFATKLWEIVSEPAAAALRSIGAEPELIQLDAMDGFLVVYFKLPLLAALFIASPWVLWQVWAFIAPGLYKHERKMAAPFVISTAGLFIAGGCFAYFVAFRFGLAFLLGIGINLGNTQGAKIKPAVSIVTYFDLFVNVMLGIGATFELPVLIFFLTMLRIVTPAFLIEHSRYAILAITVLAAFITPTPDIVNLLIFAVPMILLYFVGVFAGWLLVLSREGKKFPWAMFSLVLLGILLTAAGAVWVMVNRMGFKLIPQWPFLTQ